MQFDVGANAFIGFFVHKVTWIASVAASPDLFPASWVKISPSLPTKDGERGGMVFHLILRKIVMSFTLRATTASFRCETCVATTTTTTRTKTCTTHPHRHSYPFSFLSFTPHLPPPSSPTFPLLLPPSPLTPHSPSLLFTPHIPFSPPSHLFTPVYTSLYPSSL